MEKSLSTLMAEYDAAWQEFCKHPSDNNWILFQEANQRAISAQQGHKGRPAPTAGSEDKSE